MSNSTDRLITRKPISMKLNLARSAEAEHLSVIHNDKQIDAILIKHDILLNTLPQGIMTVNNDARIQTCNKRGAEILGFSESEIVGISITKQPWKAIKVDGSVFPVTEFPAVI